MTDSLQILLINICPWGHTFEILQLFTLILHRCGSQTVPETENGTNLKRGQCSRKKEWAWDWEVWNIICFLLFRGSMICFSRKGGSGLPCPPFPFILLKMHECFCTDVLDSQRMNPVDLADPLTFSLVPPAGRHFWPLLEYLDIYWIALELSTVIPPYWLWWFPNFSCNAINGSKFLHAVLCLNIYRINWNKSLNKH